VNPLKVIFEIPKNPPPKLEGDQFSNKFKDFVACCLQKDPNARPTATMLLQHEFMKETTKPALWTDRVTMMIQILAILVSFL
jgi:serine/threonine-protein kinase 24/25/MST4